MRHRVFAVGSILSVLVCVACAMMLVRSFWIADEMEYHHYFADNVVATRRSFFLRTDHGTTYFAYRMLSGPSTPLAIRAGKNFYWRVDMPGFQTSWYFKPPTGPRLPRQWTVWDHAGFLWASTPGPMGFGGYQQRQVILRFPALIVVVLTALPPMVYLRTRRRRAKQIGDPLCSKCGYNLTGNTSGVCPECGAANPAEPLSAAKC